MAPVNAAWFELSAHRPHAGPGGGGVGVVGGAMRRSAQRDCSCWTCPAGDTQGKYSCASVVYLQIHPCFVDGDFCVLFNNSFFFFFYPEALSFILGGFHFYILILNTLKSYFLMVSHRYQPFCTFSRHNLLKAELSSLVSNITVNVLCIVLTGHCLSLCSLPLRSWHRYHRGFIVVSFIISPIPSKKFGGPFLLSLWCLFQRF